MTFVCLREGKPRKPPYFPVVFLCFSHWFTVFFCWFHDPDPASMNEDVVLQKRLEYRQLLDEQNAKMVRRPTALRASASCEHRF